MEEENYQHHHCQSSTHGGGEVAKLAEEIALAIPPHPLGIKPAGNAFAASSNIKLAAGLFSLLPDEIIMQIVESLNAASLLQLGATGKALYAFCHFDELWKTLQIEYVFSSSFHSMQSFKSEVL